MKKLFITLGTLLLGLAIYEIIRGDSLLDQISLLVIAAVQFSCAFIDPEKVVCEKSKKS